MTVNQATVAVAPVLPRLNGINDPLQHLTSATPEALLGGNCVSNYNQ